MGAAPAGCVGVPIANVKAWKRFSRPFPVSARGPSRIRGRGQTSDDVSIRQRRIDGTQQSRGAGNLGR
jgi:hypothetical protein